MSKFYMVVKHPRLGTNRLPIKDADTWHKAVDKTLEIMAGTAMTMCTLKGIEIETE